MKRASMRQSNGRNYTEFQHLQECAYLAYQLLSTHHGRLNTQSLLQQLHDQKLPDSIRLYYDRRHNQLLLAHDLLVCQLLTFHYDSLNMKPQKPKSYVQTQREARQILLYGKYHSLHL